MHSSPSSGHYIDIAEVAELQNYFSEKIKQNKLDKDKDSVSKIRQFMFDFFETPSFKKLYFKIAREVICKLPHKTVEIALQQLPTPRVFRPGAIGTSLHCDYWYGHGVQAKTIWIPLSELDELNTFRILKQTNQGNPYQEDETENIHNLDLKEFNSKSEAVLPKFGQAFVFGSKLLHGSPLNTSDRTRLSIDFRISLKGDTTSTKDLANYYQYDGNGFVIVPHGLKNKRLLKYICGGKGKNTLTQHILIEETAKRLDIGVSEQEAEIERFNYPIIRRYLSEKIDSPKIDGIIIASISILDPLIILEAKQSNMPVWCALENDFIKNL
jgi:hypothetical protein